MPIEREEYDLVLRADFAASDAARALLETIRSPEFHHAVAGLGGYDLRNAGTIKRPVGPAPVPAGRPQGGRNARR